MTVCDELVVELGQALCEISELLRSEFTPISPGVEKARQIAVAALELADEVNVQYRTLWRVSNGPPEEGPQHTFYVLADDFQQCAEFITRPGPHPESWVIYSVEQLNGVVFDATMDLEMRVKGCGGPCG
jgi:hypothetical protein